ncbi:hypothetical protein DTO166G4_1935 [Paecilomyces variotii]|nr:hypothetical protein DTO032I3_3996 [Paecilomyces variotii]KAJ9216347.1 hypothetical protein DTO166G4_1935 [Paecilomyces variotii]KAJ9234621.1 hypothetical protein DTO166G5_4974 [Paecilomyces variotii]KAJ9245700.1 hypothetical protein DTO169E5_419 [Paecilomyces variotii]KAJ9262856.1 hypothetical protein DTO195F2_3221 [Paecilomyces variotii]
MEFSAYNLWLIIHVHHPIQPSSTNLAMAAISLIEHATVPGVGGPDLSRRRHHRHNWAAREPGVVLVFCIVFLVACGFLALFLYRRWLARKAIKAAEDG